MISFKLIFFSKKKSLKKIAVYQNFSMSINIPSNIEKSINDNMSINANMSINGPSNTETSINVSKSPFKYQNVHK